MSKIDDCPAELADAIREFFPSAEWENAAAISELESGWSAFAEANTTGPGTPCGTFLFWRDGTAVTAERSLGWFQINTCNLPPDWTPDHLFNTRHNVGTAHLLWANAGGRWSPWFFSAKRLGLI